MIFRPNSWRYRIQLKLYRWDPCADTMLPARIYGIAGCSHDMEFQAALISNVRNQWLLLPLRQHQTGMHPDKHPGFQYQLGTPPEPHPSPIQDPIDPPENPDVPIREPDPEDPGQI